MADLDPAHVLFPSDAPKPQAVPDWFAAQRSGAELRLAGSHDASGATAKALDVGNAATPQPSAGEKPDAAATMFESDAPLTFDAKPVAEIFDGFASSAISDNDGGERARAIEAARDGLIADAKTAGTDAADLADAMAIVKERQADSLSEPTPEQAEQRMTEAMELCRAENITDADLNLARRFVADLEIVAPGTIATLNRTGGGNDIRLIRKAVAEARRRGYR